MTKRMNIIKHTSKRKGTKANKIMKIKERGIFLKKKNVTKLTSFVTKSLA